MTKKSLILINSTKKLLELIYEKKKTEVEKTIREFVRKSANAQK